MAVAIGTKRKLWNRDKMPSEVDVHIHQDDPFIEFDKMFHDSSEIPEDLVFKMSSLDYDANCQYDLMTGNGFLIQNTSWADKACMIPNVDGPRSTNFGFPKGEFSYIDNYRCECGEIIGSFLKGEICPKCKTLVDNRDIDLRTTGWISFGKYKVISPIFYEQLSSSIGGKLFQNIISYEHAYSTSGVRKDIHEQYYIKSPGSSKVVKVGPYYSVGMHNFYLHFEEIITYYLHKKNPTRLKYFLDNKHKVFTSVFPVYSTALRPVEISADSYQFTSVDRYIEPLANCAKQIIGVRENDVYLDMLLTSAQSRIMSYWKEVLNLTNGKNGSIRSNIMGGTFNYTARSVICLDASLEYDEIDIGYSTAYVLYRGEIIKEIMDDQVASIRKASDIFYGKDQNYVWEMMRRWRQRTGPRLVLTRNPLINFQGITSSAIRNIRPDPNFMMLVLPLMVLPGFNADFDGDQMNMYKVPDTKYYSAIKMFDNFNPRTHHAVSRINNEVDIGLSALENTVLWGLSNL